MVRCKKQLAECQTELLQVNGELNQLLIEHESQCNQHENVVKALENEKHNCESRLETATTKIKSLQKQIQDSHEIISELESLIAQNKEQSAETSLQEEVRQLTALLEQKEAELTAVVKQLEDLHQSQEKDGMVMPDVGDNHEKSDSVVSTSTTSSVDDSDQEEIENDGKDTINIIDQLKLELTSNDEQIRQLKEELEQQAQTIVSIKENNTQLSSHNAIVSESNVTLAANVQHLQDIVNEKDENIRILNEGLTQLQSQYDAQQQTLSTKCSSLMDENKILSADLATRNEEIEELKHALQQSGDVMAQLRGELADVLESNKSLINSLESDKTTTNAQLVEKVSELKIAQQQLVQAQEELQLKEKQLQKIENQLASQSKDFKITEEALEQMKVTTHGMQENIDKLEAQLVEAKAEIIKCNEEKDKLEMVSNT